MRFEEVKGEATVDVNDELKIGDDCWFIIEFWSISIFVHNSRLQHFKVHGRIQVTAQDPATNC